MVSGSPTGVFAISRDVGWIVWTPAPGMLKTIASTVGPGEPAEHSPASAPDAVLVCAAVIASRSVQTPSLAAVSALLLTVIVAADATEAAKPRPIRTMARKIRAPCVLTA